MLPGGHDYARVHGGGTLAEMSVSAAARGQNTAAVFQITSHGLCQWDHVVTAMVKQAPEARSSAFGEVETWQVFRVNTDSEEYGWLNYACLIGQEKLEYREGRMAATVMRLYQFLVR